MGSRSSYFLPKPGATGEIAKKQVEMKWLYQVQPLLREYEQLLNLDANSLRVFNQSLEISAWDSHDYRGCRARL